VLERDAANHLVLRKHHLAAGSRADEPIGVMGQLIGLHATDPLSPSLQLRARLTSFESAQLDALLDEGRAARVTCMRGTLFVQAAELIPLVAAATRRVLARGRDHYLAAGTGSGVRWDPVVPKPFRLGGVAFGSRSTSTPPTRTPFAPSA
jgi:hypothetical protein